jgi:hypothetical protein
MRARAAGCLVAAAACWGAPRVAAAGSTATATATPTATPRPTPTISPVPGAPAAPRPRPALLPHSRAAAIEPAGPAPLAQDAETVVDPASSFHVELPGRIADARLVLLDASDAHVEARSTHEVGGKTQLTLAPASPLVPGSRYVLRVEGATAREVREGDRAYAPISFTLLAAGTPPPPEPKKKPKKLRKRR